jgi:ubiquitin-conjugating enzyme E2 J2
LIERADAHIIVSIRYARYPLKPPSVLMYTPNGRFKTGQRLCLSNSDFHPESWNPVWGVSTILMGLYSFMLETAPTLGSVETSLEDKQRYAAESLEFNCRNPVFRSMFPDLAELQELRVSEAQREAEEAVQRAANKKALTTAATAAAAAAAADGSSSSNASSSASSSTALGSTEAAAAAADSVRDGLSKLAL